MANLTDSGNYDAGVYQLATTDPVLGGAGGVANAPTQNLANRTSWLKARALASLRMEGITPITGGHVVSVADIGHVLSVHNPSSASFSLPDLATFPNNEPFTIVITDDGGSSVVNVSGHSSDIVEDWLNSGTGAGVYPLHPGDRVVFVATATSWVVIFKDNLSATQSALSAILTRLTADEAAIAKCPVILTSGTFFIGDVAAGFGGTQVYTVTFAAPLLTTSYMVFPSILSNGTNATADVNSITGIRNKTLNGFDIAISEPSNLVQDLSMDYIVIATP